MNVVLNDICIFSTLNNLIFIMIRIKVTWKDMSTIHKRINLQNIFAILHCKSIQLKLIKVYSILNNLAIIDTIQDTEEFEKTSEWKIYFAQFFGNLLWLFKKFEILRFKIPINIMH